MADVAEWLPTTRLTAYEAQQHAMRLLRALGAAWRVTVFSLHHSTGNASSPVAPANVEIRPARPPMRPAVVLRTAAECEAYLTAWVAAHGEPEAAAAAPRTIWRPGLGRWAGK